MEGGVVSAGGSQGATSNVDLTDGDAALTVDISGKASINSTICTYQNIPQPEDLIKDIIYVNIATEYITALLHKAAKSLTELIYELRNKSTTEPHWFPQALPSS